MVEPYFQAGNITLYCGNNIEVLPALDVAVSAVCTDPPYGLSKEPDIAEVLTHWLAGDDYTHGGGGFMSAKWDSFVPGPATWRLVAERMLPGAHLCAFAGTRTSDLMGMAIRLAGLERRDTLCWLQGAGFPKSLSVSKAIDRMAGAEREVVGESETLISYNRGAQGGNDGWKRPWNQQGESFEKAKITAPATDAARQWDGWGTALKPAYEPIILARKPFPSTVAAQVLATGTGAINVDGCRVGTGGQLQWAQPRDMGYHGGSDAGSVEALESSKGRWPPNVLLDPTAAAMLDAMSGERKSGGKAGTTYDTGAMPSEGWGNIGKGGSGRCISDTGGSSRFFPVLPVDDPDDSEELTGYPCDRCGWVPIPESMIDQDGNYTGKGCPACGYEWVRDPAWAARLLERAGITSPLPVDDPDTLRFLYQPKASRAERNAGLEGMPERGRTFGHKRCSKCGKQKVNVPGSSCQCSEPEWVAVEDHAPRANHHPTVKSLAVMKWLLTLVTPPGGIVLDPFAGSGTTGVAAAQLGFPCILIEQDESYAEIAARRIEHALAKARQLEMAAD